MSGNGRRAGRPLNLAGEGRRGEPRRLYRSRAGGVAEAESGAAAGRPAIAGAGTAPEAAGTGDVDAQTPRVGIDGLAWHRGHDRRGFGSHDRRSEHFQIFPDFDARAVRAACHSCKIGNAASRWPLASKAAASQRRQITSRQPAA